MTPSCRCFPQVSKTFYVKVDAAKASTSHTAEFLRHDGSNEEIETFLIWCEKIDGKHITGKRGFFWPNFPGRC
jgi:hypothetical protein